jgi:hypothetical protein
MHYDQQPQNLYLYKQWNPSESYRSTTERKNARHSILDHHGRALTITYSITNYAQSNKTQATKDYKLKLFAFSTKYELHSKIYTDGSKKDEKVRYAVVLSENTIKRSQFPQNLIYSAEKSAIMNVIYSTASYIQKRVIIIDSLSTIIAVADRKRSKNPKFN